MHVVVSLFSINCSCVQFSLQVINCEIRISNKNSDNVFEIVL